MPPYSDVTGRFANVIAGTWFILVGGGCMIAGIVHVFSGSYLAGTGRFALAVVLLTMSWRGHINLQEFLDQRKRTGTPEP